jgi:hypothetical protein
MTGDKVKFHKLDESLTGRVKFGDASAVQIMGKGSILFKCKNGDQWLLQEVYYIPMLRTNFVSLGLENGHKIIMDGNELVVYVKNPWQLLMIMKVKHTQNRLYRIDLQLASPVCLLARLDEPA